MSSKSNVSHTIDRMINATTASSASSFSNSFIPSTKWDGPREGYYFGTGDEGSGYYIDYYQQHINRVNRKRPRDDTNTNGNHSIKRKVRFGQDEIKTIESNNRKDKVRSSIMPSGENLLEEAEEQSKSNKSLDLSRGLSSLKSSVLNLEKSITKNQMLRAEYPNKPEKFMESEVSLYEEITMMNDLAASVQYYQAFTDLGAVESLKTLLIHENIDVVLSVIKLFAELIDPELVVNSESEGGTLIAKNLGILIMAFLGWKTGNDNIGDEARGENGLEMTITNLTRLNDTEEEELKGIDDILTLVENLLDLDQMGVLKLATRGEGEGGNLKTDTISIASILTKSTNFTSYLLIKLSDRKLEDWTVSMRLHGSEIVAAILQHEDSRKYLSNISKMTSYQSKYEDEVNNEKKTRNGKGKINFDGMECLLQCIASYRKKDPTNEEECEYLENIFDSLAASLLSDSNVDAFLERQGIELMIRCITERVHAGLGSIKILFFCVSGTSESYKRAAETFVDAGGLKILFPIFMGRKSTMPKPAKSSDAGNIELLRKYAALENGRKGKQQEEKKSSKRMKRVLAGNKEWFQSIEANSIQIIYGLTRYLDEQSPHDAQSRLLSKFVEKDFEKCDRLIELCLKYDIKMRQAEYDYYKSDEAEEAEENGVDVDLAALNAKLRGGGDIFHRLGAIVAFAAMGSKRSHEHIIEHLRTQNSGIGVIKAAIQEFASIIDDVKQQSQFSKYLSII